MKKIISAAACSAIAMMAGIPVSAHAQAADEPEAASASDNGQIADIVVTAQRRKEAAQNVPIALQSFSSDQLKRVAVKSTEDLTSVVGGLIIQPTAARPAIFVRGVGTNSSNTTPAILTFVDGVYYPFGQSLDFSNIASIEVLKGPQGTLFGRNATGGVIQVTTKAPSATPSVRGEIGYGNYGTMEGNAYATAGLASNVAMDFALNFRDQSDGYGTNVFNGADVFFTNKLAVRSRLRVDLSDSTSVTIGGDFSKVRGTVGTTVSPAFGYGQVFAGGAIRLRGPGQYYPGDYDVNAGPLTPSFRSKEWGVNGTLESEFSGVTFRSITAYRESRENIVIDFDGTAANLTNLGITRSPRSAFTQELQLLSGDSSRLKWVVGLFYYDFKANTNPFDLDIRASIPGCNSPTPVPCRRQAFAVDTDKSIAGYAQATYEILPQTNLTLGGRYTIEKRRIRGSVIVNGVDDPNRAGSQSQKFKEPTWRVALDHRFTPDVMVYGSVSRGFNAGLFNGNSVAGFRTPAQNPAVRPEFLTAYELGAKTDLLGRRLRINLSGFIYDYSDLQQQIYDNGAVVTINAASAKIKGIDLEATLRATNSLTFTASGTYLDAKYKSYPAAPNYVVNANTSITAIGSLDAAGKSIVNAPKWSFTVGASHVLDTSIGSFTTSANVNYRGKTYIDPLNRFPLPTRYVMDATERWTSTDERFFATLWVKNLFDKKYDYAVNILTPVGLVSNPAPPRTYGASIGFQF